MTDIPAVPRLTVALVAACAAAVVAVRAGTVQSELEILLRRVADYVAAYEQEMSGVVAEETYVQQTSSGGPIQSRQESRADIAIILINGTSGWVAFRDVFEVNGRPVRDREDRLARLFARPDQDDLARARQIVAESGRFNLNPPGVRLARTINVPLIALKFVRGATQSRSAFELDRPSGRPGRARLRFRERAKPRIIETPEGSGATGWLIVDATTGRIEETELVIETGDTRATYRTIFSSQPGFRVWLPISMQETYVVAAFRQLQRQLDARATYGNFRTFGVSVSTGASGPD